VQTRYIGEQGHRPTQELGKEPGTRKDFKKMQRSMMIKKLLSEHGRLAAYSHEKVEVSCIVV
jgi:hypothetical protein